MKRIKVGDFILGKEEKQAIKNVIKSGRITEGKQTADFEKEYAKYVGTKYCVAVNSGTSALMAGLSALKINKFPISKSRVITTPLTYIATSNALLNAGLCPVYADIDPKTFCITPEAVDQLMEENLPFGILPVHLMGNPCKIDKIKQIAKKHNLWLFEDACQAHGTKYQGKRVGSFGDLSCFSFFVAHNIQAGELGCVCTDDVELYKLIKSLKANGRTCTCSPCTRHEGTCPNVHMRFDPRFTFNHVGFNFKTVDFCTALARVQLRKADDNLKKRYENVRYLNEGLQGLGLQLPKLSKDISYLEYYIVPETEDQSKMLRFGLEREGIETRPLYGCIPLHQPSYEVYKEQYEGKLPVAEQIGLKTFYVGCHQYLKQHELDKIIKTVRKLLRNHA